MDLGEGSRAGCREKRQIGWGVEAERSAGCQKKRRKGQGGEAVMDFDVFLNHRGPDVKGAFVAHLYQALKAERLNPFLDKYSLAQGSPAFESIKAALEAAKVHVAVVSVGYADSTHCLSELVAMLRSEKPVIPVFYDVEPAELRRVETGAFAAALEKHRSRETEEQVREWVDALRKLANITAFVFRLSDYRGDEAELKQQVVHAVLRLLPRFLPLQVEKYLVGLEGHLETCVSAVKAMSDTRGVLGLVGMRGVGKGCLAKVMYNHLGNHGEFKASCFLEIGQTLRSSEKDPASWWLKRLQSQLFWDLMHLGEQSEAQPPYEYWFDKLSSLGPVLIGLNDMQDKDHFVELISIANALAPGSCIIITSCDRHVLNLSSCGQHLMKCVNGTPKFYLHEMTPLGSEDSLKLFNWHAFGDEKAPKNFKALSENVSKGYGGLPMALKIVGQGLHGKTTYEQHKSVWLEAVEALGHHDIRSALKRSYDCLCEKDKLMFVDMACFFCGWTKYEALEILQSCTDCSSCCGNKSPYASLENLINKFLVTLDKNVITMHSLVQEMGQHIGTNEGSHLKKGRAMKAVKFKVQNQDRVRALQLACTSGKCELDVKKFKKMPNLHLLSLDGCTMYGNSEDIFEEVRHLQLRNSTLKRLPCMPKFFNLVSLDISESSKLTGLEIELEGCLNLVSLNLSKCGSITRLPYSIGRLFKLKVLNLNGCGKLRKLPVSMKGLTSLQELLMCGCDNLIALQSFITGLPYFMGPLQVQFTRTSTRQDFHSLTLLESYLSTTQAVNIEHVQSRQRVMFSSGYIDKKPLRGISLVVSTKPEATQEMLKCLCKALPVLGVLGVLEICLDYINCINWNESRLSRPCRGVHQLWSRFMEGYKWCCRYLEGFKAWHRRMSIYIYLITCKKLSTCDSEAILEAYVKISSLKDGIEDCERHLQYCDVILKVMKGCYMEAYIEACAKLLPLKDSLEFYRSTCVLR